MDRKEFIKTCGLVCIGGTALATLLESCKTAFYAPHTFSENKIIISKTAIEQNNSFVIKNDALQAPVYISKLNESNYSAVLMYCTHKGCELNLAGNYLICPCHGSEFSNTGKVLSSPADKDLLQYEITSDNENIYIHL